MKAIANMKKSILCFCLAIALVMVMSIPNIVSAAESEYKEWTSVDSLPTSGTYKLMNDVTIETEFLKYPDISGDLTLDLNGNTVTIKGDAVNGLNIRKSGSLTIEDSAGNGKIVNGSDGVDNLIYINGGNFVLKGGTVENVLRGGTTVYVNAGGKGILTKGEILNTAESGQALFVNGDNTAVVLDGAMIKNASSSFNSRAVYLNGGNKGIGASFEMLSGTVTTATTASSHAAIYANNGAASIKISGGTIESATVGVYAAFTPVKVTGGSISAKSDAFQTRNAVVEQAEGSEITVQSDKALFYTFSGSNNKVDGGTFDVKQIEKAYSEDKDNPTVTAIDSGIFSVDPSDYVTNPANGVVSDGKSVFAAGTEEELNEAIKQMIENGATTIEVQKGNVDLTVETDGITFVNKGGGDVTVNGQEVTDKPAEVHVHNAVKTEAKPATEKEAGNIEYWYCADCGKYFSDEALTKEIKKEETIIPMLKPSPDNEDTNKPDTDKNNDKQDTDKDKADKETTKTSDPISLGLLLAVMGASGAGIAGLKKRKK